MNAAQPFSNLPPLLQRPRCADWGAKVQYVCETIWSALDDANDILADDINNFINFLSDNDTFSLAELVIPEFRDKGSAPHVNGHKRHIMSSLTTLVDKRNIDLSKTQEAYDTPLYRAEKRAFYDADLHRMQLFLRQSRRFTPEEQAKIQLWIEQCPVRSRSAEMD